MRSNHPINNVTKLLYLEDQYKLSASAHIMSVSSGDDEVSVLLDQTPMYVKRGVSQATKARSKATALVSKFVMSHMEKAATSPMLVNSRAVYQSRAMP